MIDDKNDNIFERDDVLGFIIYKNLENQNRNQNGENLGYPIFSSSWHT